ncbi:MAG: hypothetical protein R2941_10410 [Desulfobacterales bacterium]
MKKASEKGRTRWHILLGKLLQELPEPLGITVYTEFSVTAAAPRADILLIRKKHRKWTREQLRVLPDGIRDSSAEHILIEFKYTESVGRKTFRQILGYETLYTQSRSLADKNVQSFVISAKTPEAAVLKDIGYFPSGKKGVHRHDFQMLSYQFSIETMLSFNRKGHKEGAKVTADRQHCIKSARVRYCLPQEVIYILRTASAQQVPS